MQEQDYIAFDAYLEGSMTADAQTEFEARLKKEAVFNQEFKAYSELHKFLEHRYSNEEETRQFTENLKTISGRYFNKKEEKTGFRFKYWQYAAAAIALVLIGIFTFNQLSQPHFEDYNTYTRISLAVRGAENQQLQEAEEAFNDRDFEHAAKYLSALVKESPDNKELQLYYGIALMETDQNQKATAIFSSIYQEPSAYSNKAIWYAALNKLKQKDEPASLELLKRLPEDAEDYEKAQKIIRKLK